MVDVAIIGGGAAGLMAACMLQGFHVVLLEKQPRVGRKLLATGNGRCNLTNMNAAPSDYHGCGKAASVMLKKQPPRRVRQIFETLGLPTVEDAEGRVYPMSNLAASVLDALRLSAAERGCEIRTEWAAESVKKEKNGFVITSKSGENLRAKKVLLATGGLAAPKLGACGDGYAIMEALGHGITPRFPAIAALKTDPERVRALKGQKIVGSVTLYTGDRVLRREEGELLFTENGLSGIACMQLARACGEALRTGKKVYAEICTAADGCELIERRAKLLPERALEDFLNGIVSKRIGEALLKQAGIAPLSRKADTLTERERRSLGELLEAWRFPITATQGFEAAQVTAGGVSMDAFDLETMESKKVPGLYAAGELLDVDGDCGGFNLQWAWASALTAAEDIKKKLIKTTD